VPGARGAGGAAGAAALPGGSCPRPGGATALERR